jgi:hypothetical protein
MENGSETESVDVMHYLWNNEWPVNRTPKLLDFKLAGKTAYENIRLKVGSKIHAFQSESTILREMY